MSSITLSNVTMRFGGRDTAPLTALQEITQDVEDGAFISIVGPSGCGKSTLLSIISGLQSPTTGAVVVGEREVSRPARDVGIIFQEDSTLPWRTVMGNVKFGMQVAGVPAREQDRIAKEMIALVGLGGFEDSYPAKLSGGMRQRVAIARTLALGPKVLLMDEPFGALDSQTRLVIGTEVRRIWQQTGTTVMFVTHDIQEAIMLSQRIWVMSYRPGRITDVVDVDLPPERGLDCVATEQFSSMSARIWGKIRTEVTRAFEADKVSGG